MLLTVGMLHFRKHPADVKKAYPFAAVAKMEGVSFFYFSYHQVDFNSLKINGWVYENGHWIQKQMDFPAVVINSSNPKTEKQAKIAKKLKEQTIFTSYPVGNKMKIYNKILKAEKFADYLIPSIRITESRDTILLLHQYSKAVVKPLAGNHGKNVVFIENLDDKYKVTDGLDEKYVNQSELESILNQLLEKRKYLFQPFIECKTKNGLTYDFRLHVQKNGFGEWEITLIYPRISGSTRLISNISSGGYRGELKTFLLDEFENQSEKINDMLESFALKFSAHLDSLYSHSFDELGIDVGIDAQQKMWIFEVNWRPGSNNREFEVARRMIPYCKFLGGKH